MNLTFISNDDGTLRFNDPATGRDYEITKYDVEHLAEWAIRETPENYAVDTLAEFDSNFTYKVEMSLDVVVDGVNHNITINPDNLVDVMWEDLKHGHYNELIAEQVAEFTGKDEYNIIVEMK